MEGLLIYKYILVGNGDKVADYAGDEARKFTHRKLNKKVGDAVSRK
jgi:glutamate-5-semialdehyde dehydrogenase